MTLKLLYDRIAIKRAETITKTKGGILIPEISQEQQNEGIVIAVGTGNRNQQGNIIPLDIKVGDKVLFKKWNGTDLKIEGEEIMITRESDIMAILD